MDKLYVGAKPLFTKGEFTKEYKHKIKELRDKEICLEKEKEAIVKYQRS